MRAYVYFFIVSLMFVVSCTDETKNDITGADKIYEEYLQIHQDRSYHKMDHLIIDSIARIYMEVDSPERAGVCYLLNGFAYYNDKNYSAAIEELCKSDDCLTENDSIIYELYYAMALVLDELNDDESRYYAEKLMDYATEHHNLTAEIYANSMMSSLSDNFDSANVYRLRTEELCRKVGNVSILQKTNSDFARNFCGQMDPDSAVNLIIPRYERMHFAGDARKIAFIYLSAGENDKALPYIEKLKENPFFSYDYKYYMAIYLANKKMFEDAILMYDSAHREYIENQNEAADMRVSEINAAHNRKIFEQKQELMQERLKTSYWFILFCAVSFVILLLVSILIYERMKISRQKSELQNLRLERENYTKKQTLLAVSEAYRDILVLAIRKNHDLSYSIGHQLYQYIKKSYPQLKEKDITYLFLSYIKLDVVEICDILNISTGTWHVRINRIRKLMDLEQRTKLDTILEMVFK